MRRYASQSDDQLVQLYATGCNEAFNELLHRYDSYVHTYIRYSVQDEDLAEDIFQDTFIKVMTTIRQGRYSAEGKFKSWISRIAHNLIIDHFRRLKTRGQEQMIEDTQSADEALFTLQLSSDELSAEEQLIRHEHISELSRGLAKLSPEQREVIRLRYWEELSFKEIAEKTNVSINTALGRMRYALAHLRRHIQA
ncbi:RNA polymerase sigma factor [Porphyromonas sp.]